MKKFLVLSALLLPTIQLSAQILALAPSSQSSTQVYVTPSQPYGENYYGPEGYSGYYGTTGVGYSTGWNGYHGDGWGGYHGDGWARGGWSGHEGNWDGHGGSWSGHEGNWDGHGGGWSGHEGNWDGHGGGWSGHEGNWNGHGGGWEGHHIDRGHHGR